MKSTLRILLAALLLAASLSTPAQTVTPPEVAAKAPTPHGEYVPALAGPVVSGQAHTDVVTDQSQVDDLLASLGF